MGKGRLPGTHPLYMKPPSRQLCPLGGWPSPLPAVWAQRSMQTPQVPGWGFLCSISGFYAASHDAIGVGRQEIGKMVGAGATGV